LKRSNELGIDLLPVGKHREGVRGCVDPIHNALVQLAIRWGQHGVNVRLFRIHPVGQSDYVSFQHLQTLLNVVSEEGSVLRVKELCFEENAHIVLDFHQGIQFEKFIHALHSVFVRFLFYFLELLGELSDRNQLSVHLS